MIVDWYAAFGARSSKLSKAVLSVSIGYIMWFNGGASVVRPSCEHTASAHAGPRTGRKQANVFVMAYYAHRHLSIECKHAV
jgi:hypothetical protein